MSEDSKSCVLTSVLPDFGTNSHVTDCVEHYNKNTVFDNSKLLLNSKFNDGYVRMSDNYITLSWRQDALIDGQDYMTMLDCTLPYFNGLANNL